MQTRQRPSGVQIDFPDSYGLVAPGSARARNGAGRRRARTRGALAPELPSIDQAQSAIDEWLDTQDLRVVDEIDLETGRPGRAGTRAVRTAERFVSLGLDAAPGESALLLVEQDGVFSWAFPREAHDARGVRASRREPERLHFDVPLLQLPGAERRVLGIDEFAERVKAKVFKFVMGHGIKFFERKVDPGFVALTSRDPSEWRRARSLDGLGLDLDGSMGKPPRLFLFVHGTFSSTVGSFRALAATRWGRELLDALAGEYDAVIGYDHATLSETPESNATDLLSLLAAYPWKRPPLLDGVAYSRGGLVLRSLIELQLPRSGFDARFSRAAFVGSTNAGTQLADPANWHDLINTYTNLAVSGARVLSLIPGMPPLPGLIGESLNTVAGFAKYLATQTIDRQGVPGLAAMDPDGEFVRRLNRTQPGQPGPRDISYYAVVSDFEPGPGSSGLAGELPKRLVTALADPIVDRLMGAQNDLVVDTPSMTAIDEPGSELVKEVLDFGPNGSVYHLAYFTQEELGRAFHKWFELPADRARDRAARAGANGRGDRFLLQRSGTLRPREALAAARRLLEAADVFTVERPRLKVEVVWGDIRHAKGDVFAAGHYVGVLPQRAELALDGIVSAVEPWPTGDDDEEEEERKEERLRQRKEENRRQLVLTRMTRRNQLRGELGEIDLFPRGDGGPPGRLVAICGMGHLGSFGATSLRRLHRTLISSLMAFPEPRELTTVLIGAGEGNLSVEVAVRGLACGFADAVRAGADQRRVPLIRIVERYWHQAERILQALNKLADDPSAPVELELHPRVTVGRGRRIRWEDIELQLMRAALGLGADPTFDEIVTRLPRQMRIKELRPSFRRVWDAAGGKIDALAQRRVDPTLKEEEGPGEWPSRVSFVRDGPTIRTAFLTNTATIPERVISVDPGLVMEAAERMIDPDPSEIESLSRTLYGLVVDRDFRAELEASDSLVLELDRDTAGVSWEMLPAALGHDRFQPIGLSRVIARQLRTTYSPPPGARGRQDARHSALVIGDPGDPAKNQDLDGARREAIAVAKLLERHGFDVNLMIGAPGHEERGTRAATRLDVLHSLMSGEIDLVHYSGHGDFDEEHPDEVGWVFATGLLTAREIARIDRAPPLIVANACLSGRHARSRVDQDGGAQREAALLPSLADEFFRRGVLNYVGTAWEIDDQGAVEFASEFYGQFLSGTPLGDAMLEARKRLDGQRDRYGALWAAYHLYGDPGFTVKDLNY